MLTTSLLQLKRERKDRRGLEITAEAVLGELKAAKAALEASKNTIAQLEAELQEASMDVMNQQKLEASYEVLPEQVPVPISMAAQEQCSLAYLPDQHQIAGFAPTMAISDCGVLTSQSPEQKKNQAPSGRCRHQDQV